MEIVNNNLFYSRLPVNEIPLGELLLEDHLFYKVPANWQVVVTDVKNSTAAVQNGLHETINLIATASIVAVLNIIYKANITIPFFFGGDGATFIIPPDYLETVMQALIQHRENTRTNFNLDLRIGHVPAKEIYEQGHDLQISKLRTSGLFVIPIILGDGLMIAEKIIKGPDYRFSIPSATEDVLDLSGMQCRWDKIKPPQNEYEVVSLLAVARRGTKQSQVFKKVMDCLENIYGEPGKRTPITVGKLKLKPSFAKLGLEVKTRMGEMRIFQLMNIWIRTALGFLYFKTRGGKKYLHTLVEMADTLIIDGRINTVITGSSAQRKLLEAALQKIEEEGEIHFGLHVSPESVMSCYVRNINDRHVHFVDGAGGGYTKAAGMLKNKNRPMVNLD